MYVNSSESSELMGQLPCTSTHQGSPKSLGACSPRETPMKEPTSAHELSSYGLLVGRPICQNAGKQDQKKPQANSRKKTPLQGTSTLSKAKTPHQGTSTLSKAKTPREAKFKHLVKFPFAGCLPLKSLFSFLRLMGCLRVKGEPQASCLVGSYFLRPHTPPGLVEP